MIRRRALKIVLVLVGLFFFAAIYPALNGLRNPVDTDTGDNGYLRHFGGLPAHRRPKPIGAPQPHRLRCLVEFRSRRGYVNPRI
jgi:hypothetical protein